MKALVLGADPLRKNIGAAVRNRIAADENWSAAADDCKSRLGGYDVPEQVDWDVDALVVTLGTTLVKRFEETPRAEIEDLIRANLTLPLLCVQRYLWERGDRGGTIVLTGSYAHDHPLTNGTLYCSAKAGINMAAKTLAWDLAEHGYKVFVIHPYHVEGTALWEKVQEGVMATRGWTREQADDYAKSSVRTGRLSSVHDVADAVFMLLDSTNPWLSGNAIELYGGTR